MEQFAMRVCRHTFNQIVIGVLAVFGLSSSAFGQSAAPLPVSLAESSAIQATAAAQANAGPVRQLSIDDAVRLALDQNLGIQVQRINPQIEDFSIAQAQSVWAPFANAALQGNSLDAPANSFLSGGQTKVSDQSFVTQVGLSQNLRWGGSSYNFFWNSSRATTSNLFTNFDPTLRSSFNFQFIQPLLRNFRTDTFRTQYLVSRKNREMSDIDLRTTVVSTLRNVKNAYWDLSYARASLAVQRQSLDLARESLRNNRSRVEIGTMAPIDIVEAEAEVAQREESVILAEASISQAEDRLRALVFDPATPDFWNIQLELTDSPPAEVQPIDVQGAVTTALDKRTDIRLAKKSLEESDLNIRYFHNQTLPDLNAQVDYGGSGLGGTEFIRGDGFPGPIIGQSNRGFNSVLNDLFHNEFPAWTLSLNVGYPIGTSNAEANLARARLQYTQAQKQIRSIELDVTTEVRDAGRNVNTNLKRVEASKESRRLAERRLQAEEKKFTAGMSTSFFVFQAQRDLSQARNNELQAVLDYSKSLTDFETVQETSLTGAGQVVTRAGSGTANTALSNIVGATGGTGTAFSGQNR